MSQESVHARSNTLPAAREQVDRGGGELRADGVGDEVWAPGAALAGSAGRGQVWRVQTRAGPAIVRHYRRGGILARWLADQYLYGGAAATRCFREFRLLDWMWRAGLPVPQPLAARFWRQGMLYRADLATAEIESARSLHEALGQGGAAGIGARLGTVLARFHATGIWHADLNAHNILCLPDGRIMLIDFDRGQRRVPAATWQQSNLDRLRRSLAKLGHATRAGFEPEFWQPLVAAHAAGLVPAAAGRA